MQGQVRALPGMRRRQPARTCQTVPFEPEVGPSWWPGSFERVDHHQQGRGHLQARGFGSSALPRESQGWHLTDRTKRPRPRPGEAEAHIIGSGATSVFQLACLAFSRVFFQTGTSRG